MSSAAEAAALGTVGGALGALTGTLAAPVIARSLGPRAAGVTVAAGAVVGAANGALSGLRGIYQWRSPKGLLALALDSTWALPITASGLFAHAVAAVRGDPRYAPALSERCNRHVYGRGFQPRKGFAVTLGNVVSGAGDVTNPRRAKLVTDHEDVHVWQARWLGPLYPLAYGGLAAGGAAMGVVGAALGKGRLGELVETCGYYLNPFEYWAYSRDDHWPPSGIAPGIGPRRPVVRSFAALGRPRS